MLKIFQYLPKTCRLLLSQITVGNSQLYQLSVNDLHPSNLRAAIEYSAFDFQATNLPIPAKNLKTVDKQNSNGISQLYQLSVVIR